MPSLEDPAVVDQLVTRLRKLHPERPRAWGKMTPHEMLCHLADSFQVGLDERQASPAETFLTRTLYKFIALRTSMAWPQGLETRPEVDPHAGGTKPEDFERDRARVIELLQRFLLTSATYGRHPFFGVMTREEWLIWGYRHTDHHLRQFAL
jgi:hypothetical protein